MMKVFFDTNIMIDVIGRREEFCEPSMRIMSLAENKKDFEASAIPVLEPQEFVDMIRRR